jgi:hypothetical protein
MSDETQNPPSRKKPGPPKGTRPAGRKKGTPNKTTAAVKNALVKTFVNMGGSRQLTKWAKENPTEFYKIWAKLLPAEVKSTVDGDVSTTVTVIQRYLPPGESSDERQK